MMLERLWHHQALPTLILQAQIENVDKFPLAFLSFHGYMHDFKHKFAAGLCVPTRLASCFRMLGRLDEFQTHCRGHCCSAFITRMILHGSMHQCESILYGSILFKDEFWREMAVLSLPRGGGWDCESFPSREHKMTLSVIN